MVGVDNYCQTHTALADVVLSALLAQQAMLVIKLPIFQFDVHLTPGCYAKHAQFSNITPATVFLHSLTTSSQNSLCHHHKRERDHP